MLTLKRWSFITLVFVMSIAFALPAMGDGSKEAALSGGEGPSYPLLRLAMENLDEDWDDVDWDDSEEMTLLAAALPELANISPEERLSFAQSYGLDIEKVDRAYFRLLGAALGAEIRLYPAAEEARHAAQVRLMALLSGEDAAREALTETGMVELAAAYHLPVDFLRHLATTNDDSGFNWAWDDDWEDDWEDDWDDDWNAIGEGHYKGRGEGHDQDGDGIDDHKGVPIRDEDGEKEKEKKDKKDKDKD